MKIAAPFPLKEKYRDLLDEYNLLCDKNSKVELLVKFSEMYPDKRINISFKEIDIDHETLIQVKEINPQVHVALYPDQWWEAESLISNKIPYFFNSSFPCYSFTTLQFLAEAGVTDVYIGDILCYNMSKVKAFCKSYNIQIRYILNEVPIMTLTPGTDIRDPIFSPRDYESLDKYIDVGEFECGSPYEWNKFEVFYKAWFVEHDWFGELLELNQDVEIKYPVRYSTPNCNKYKMNCNHNCVGLNCNHCQKNFYMIQAFQEEDLVIPVGKN